MRALLLMILLALSIPAGAAQRWEILPPTPAPIPADRGGQANVNGISLHYAVYMADSPIWITGAIRSRR
jgi:hypothetical protein